MSIYKRPESKFWWYAVRNGKQYLRGSTGTENKEIALAIERTIKSAVKRTTPADTLHKVIDALLGTQKKPGLPVSGIWMEYERYLKTINKTLSAVTIGQRRARCRKFAAWVTENWPAAEDVENVDRTCAAAYAEYLSKANTKSKTRANIISDLGTVWTALQRTRTSIAENPWRFVVPESSDSSRGKAFDREQEAAVLKAAIEIGHGWYPACIIARHTGLRLGDIARLQWSQVDLDQKLLHLTPSKTRRHGIAVTLPLIDVLHRCLADQQQTTTSDLVIPEFAMYHTRRTQIPFRVVLDAAGIKEGYTFHSWRHTFRTRLSEAGVSDELAKRLGGWTEDQTAMRYDHADRVTELKAAVEAAAR